MALEINQSHTTDMNKSVEDVEWNRLKEHRLKEAFVDGKCVGEETTLQNGFDQGYKKGFEISYPISLIKGLLSVNKLLIKDVHSPLLNKANTIEDALNKFKTNCSVFKLNRISFAKESPLSIDLQNENVDNILQEFVRDDAGETINVDGNHLNEFNIEFGILKETILSFVRECQQPLLLSQISEVFEKWEHQKLIQAEEVTKRQSESGTS